MCYFHIPVPFSAPLVEDIRLFIRVMEALKGKKVWVHCALNYRASAFMYHYRKIAFGLASEEAKSPMFNKWRPDDTWRAFMKLTAEEIVS